jgi:hypothetical protein
MTEELNPPAIHAEVEAGVAAKYRKQLNALIKTVNQSTFDIMDTLHEIKTKGYYAPKFDTFKEFTSSIDMKATKAYYLVRIKETMLASGISREQYEKVGVSKLRILSRIELVKDGQPALWDGIPVTNAIKSIVESNPPIEEINTIVAAIQGLTGDDAMTWLNVAVKQGAKKVIRQAIDLAKKMIGSVSKDDEGMSKDASDGAALEVIALDFISGAPQETNESNQ